MGREGTGVSGVFSSRLLSHPVNHMKQSQDRMPAEHARPGISHYLPYLFPHLGLIAVYPAVGAGCFSFPERASVETTNRIIEEVFALGAQVVRWGMLLAAIYGYHCTDGFFLSLYASVFLRHKMTWGGRITGS